MSKGIKNLLVIVFSLIVIVICVYYIVVYMGLSPFVGVDLNERQIVSQEVYEDLVVDRVEEVNYRVEVFARDLYVPWSIVFTGLDRVLVTERDGNLRVIEVGELKDEPVHVFGEVSSSGEAGHMGATLDPDYENNQFIYFCLTYEKNDEMFDKVVRFTDAGSELRNQQTIIYDIQAAEFHAGCRIKFGPDGKLYITTGDATEKNFAQDMNSLAGKILRVNKDGSIPSDNPFKDSAIYSFGHRNPQGLDWHPITGELYSTEHGPSGFDGPGGGDEVNLIKKGENYGWPLVSHEDNQPGLTAPLLVYTPAVAPASGMFYTGDVFPQFKNNFFFGLLRGEGIMRVVFSEDSPTGVVFYEMLKGIDVGRVRDVVQGPDGYIYFSTSNTDGRGDVREGDDKIYRIVPLKKSVNLSE